ncbi:MAG: TlpA disulfide reductase family protein [Actinomycetota bacterium]
MAPDADELRRQRRRIRRRYSITVGVMIAVAASFVVALQELRTFGTERVSRVGVADYEARAKVDDRPAPEFRQEGLDGSMIDSRDFRGKVLVVNFWASWCSPCRQEAPHLQAAWERYRDRGVAVLGVNYRDDVYAARAYEDEFEITFPSIHDPAGTIAFKFGLLGVPTTYVIDRDGRLVYEFVGRIDGDVLDRAIDDALGASP